jgi:hypothetical protein
LFFSGLFILLFISCSIPVHSQKRVEVNLTDNASEIIIVDKKDNKKVIAYYPFSPGLDLKKHPGDENAIIFPNGNAVLRVPDPSVTRKIRAWNDVSYLTNIIFVNATSEKINLLLSEFGRNIILTEGPLSNEGFVFYFNNNRCTLLHISEDGQIVLQIQYEFQSYPDRIYITNENGYYFIKHDNIENNEIFRLDLTNRTIESILPRTIL